MEKHRDASIGRPDGTYGIALKEFDDYAARRPTIEGLPAGEGQKHSDGKIHITTNSKGNGKAINNYRIFSQ